MLGITMLSVTNKASMLWCHYAECDFMIMLFLCSKLANIESYLAILRFITK
jgi:hypothetical protein